MAVENKYTASFPENTENFVTMNSGTGPSAPPPPYPNNNFTDRFTGGPLEHFFTMSSRRKFMCFYVVFMTMVALIWPSALAYVAAQHKSECFIDSMIPLWMIIYGSFGIVMTVVGLLFLEYILFTPKGGRNNVILTIFTVVFTLLVLFELAWFFVGTVYVFRAYPNVTYNAYNSSNPITTYCNPNMYKFAFGTLVAQCCIFGIFILISPCLIACLPWRKLNEI